MDAGGASFLAPMPDDAPLPADLDAIRSEGDLNLSDRRRTWQEGHLDETARALLEEDARWFLHQALSTPCLNAVQGCSGSRLVDTAGREILDFHGNNVHQVGYAHPRVLDAVIRQLHELSFCPRRYTCEPAVRLARRLAELAPGRLKRVLFAPGGTSAVGMALKLARAATGRYKTISLWESFHGASLDCISIGGEAVFRRGMEPLLPGARHVPPPDPQGCPFRCGASCTLACADFVEYVMEREGGIGAVIAEPMRCTPLVPPPDYWRRIRAACDRHGALLIFDEIPIGLGRTGRLFAFEHFGVEPDMLVLGKGLGGGVFPLAALVAREDLNDAMKAGALGHYTHEKSPVGCAAGLAVLDILEEEGLVARAGRLGSDALRRLQNLDGKGRLELRARGLGLVLGVEMMRRDGNGWVPAVDEAERAMYACLSEGLSFKVTMGNILTLTPPLTITDAEMHRALGILEGVLGRIAAGAP